MCTRAPWALMSLVTSSFRESVLVGHVTFQYVAASERSSPSLSFFMCPAAAKSVCGAGFETDHWVGLTTSCD